MTPDWLPIRCDLLEDTAVIGIAQATGLDEFGVVGRLVKLWSWANRHLEKGNAPSVTGLWVDRYLNAPGFAAAMVAVGWLSDGAEGITFTNFDRWNSKGAKRRIVTARRVENHRSKSNADSVTSGVQGALPEREGERESKKEPPNPPAGGGGGEAKPPGKSSARGKKPPQRPEAVPLPESLAACPEFVAVWAEWIADRATRKPLTERAARLQLEDLGALADPVRAVACVRASIAGQWQGIFTDGRVNSGKGKPVSRGEADDADTLRQLGMG